MTQQDPIEQDFPLLGLEYPLLLECYMHQWRVQLTLILHQSYFFLYYCNDISLIRQLIKMF